MVNSVRLVISSEQTFESGEMLVESEMVTPSGDLIAIPAVTRSQSNQAPDDNDGNRGSVILSDDNNGMLKGNL